MGKKLKVGKTRKDKFYHLAKETGKRTTRWKDKYATVYIEALALAEFLANSLTLKKACGSGFECQLS